jgi:hypothetical protein
MTQELPDDIRDILKEWTSKGVMEFRWPADDTDEIALAAAAWGGIDRKSPARAEKLIGDLKEAAENGKQKYGVKTLKKVNEGPAIDSCLDFWKTPEKNIDDIKASLKKIGIAFQIVASTIAAYRGLAYTRLIPLQQDLAENEKWAWLVSDWFFSDKNAEIDRRARAMVTEFDQKMKKTYDSTVAGNFADFHKVMGQLTELYSKMIASDESLDEMQKFITYVGS